MSPAELQCNPIIQDLQLIVNFLSAGVGLVVVGMVIFGGIKYITAGENSQAVQDAKNTIRNAIIALITFALMFTFLQWLIPGGIFSTSTGACSQAAPTQNAQPSEPGFRPF